MHENFKLGAIQFLKELRFADSDDENFKKGQLAASEQTPLRQTFGLKENTKDDKTASNYIILDDEIFVHDTKNDIVATWWLASIPLSDFENDRRSWPVIK